MFCSTCGHGAPEGAHHCPNCGGPLAPPQQAQPAANTAPQERPTGVAVLAVLGFIGTGILAIMGIGFILGGALFGSLIGEAGGDAASGGAIGTLIGGFLAFFMFIVAAVAGVVSWGLWNGMGWAWALTLVFNGLSILEDLWALVQGEAAVIVSLVVSGIIMWYLFQPPVKRYFRIGAA